MKNNNRELLNFGEESKMHVRKDLSGQKVIGIDWVEKSVDSSTEWIFNFGEHGRYGIQRTIISRGVPTSDILAYREQDDVLSLILNISKFGDKQGKIGIDTIREFYRVLYENNDRFYELGVADRGMNLIAAALFTKIQKDNNIKAIVNLLCKTYDY